LVHKQRVASWATYDKAGHTLYGGTGLPKVDRYTEPLSAVGWADNIGYAASIENTPQGRNIDG